MLADAFIADIRFTKRRLNKYQKRTCVIAMHIGFLMYLLIRNISFGNGIMTVIVRVIIGGFVYLADSIVFVFIFRKRELNSFASYFNLTRGDKK